MLNNAFICLRLFPIVHSACDKPWQCCSGGKSWTWEPCSRPNPRLRTHSRPSTTAGCSSTSWDSTRGRRGEIRHRSKQIPHVEHCIWCLIESIYKMPIFALAYMRSLHLLQSEKDLPSMMSRLIYVVVLDLGRHFWLHPTKQNRFELKANKFKKKKKKRIMLLEQSRFSIR